MLPTTALSTRYPRPFAFATRSVIFFSTLPYHPHPPRPPLCAPPSSKCNLKFRPQSASAERFQRSDAGLTAVLQTTNNYSCFEPNRSRRGSRHVLSLWWARRQALALDCGSDAVDCYLHHLFERNAWIWSKFAFGISPSAFPRQIRKATFSTITYIFISSKIHTT